MNGRRCSIIGADLSMNSKAEVVYVSNPHNQIRLRPVFGALVFNPQSLS